MVNTNLNWGVSLYSFMEIVNGNMVTRFEIPKLDLVLFFPSNERKWSLQSSFFESYFFQGMGQCTKRQNLLYKWFWKCEILPGFANDKTNSTCLIREEYKSLMESKGRNAGKGWIEKMGNVLIGSSWVMYPPMSQSVVSGKLGMESKCHV